MDAQDYLSLLTRLLPRGPYSDDPKSATVQDLQVAALCLARLRENAEALRREVVPQNADALLPDWERSYGIIPDDSVPDYLRVQKVLAKHNARPGLSIQDIQEGLYPYVGYFVDIYEQGIFRADDPRSLTDDGILTEPDEEVFRFRVYVDGAQITTPGFDRAAFEDTVNEISPAHTQGDVTFKLFAADDKFSLTDRDELSK